jgi:putative ABC transport system permease protein
MHFAEIKESFLMAMSAIKAHRLRSALTLLGVLIGVFSIIVVMTAMRVLQKNIESELSQLGTHTFQVQRVPAIQVEGPAGWEKYRRRKRLTYEQALKLQEQATLALHVGVEGWMASDQALSRYDKTNPNVELVGVTPDTFPTKNWIVEQGRGLQQSDVDSARNVCVLGQALAQKLFPRVSPLGEEIKYQGIDYSVVGVLEPRGSMFGGNQDNFFAVPITTALNRYGKERSISILVQAANQGLFDDTIEQTRGMLRTLRKVPPGEADDFAIFSNDSLITQFRSITLAVRLGVAIVSSIALLAAGIGIMNIMLVSVTERTREIGIRRAIGAKKRNILAQFILEAIVLCEVGGLLGVALGIAGGNVAALALKVPPVIPLDWVALGLFICSLVGIVFGTYPAYKAANLDPIQSLRYE